MIYLNPVLWDSELQVVDPNTATTLYYTLTDYFAWVLSGDAGAADRQVELVTALYGYVLSAQAYATPVVE